MFITMNEQGPCHVYKYSFSKIEKKMVLECSTEYATCFKNMVNYARKEVRALLKIPKILEV